MANSCNNRLHVTSDNPGELSRFIELVLPEGKLDFNSAVPVPEHLDLEEQVKWRRDNWGAKGYYDVNYLETSGDEIVCFFDTPWSPPKEWVIAAAPKFPSLNISLIYAEEGAGFSGRLAIGPGAEILEDVTFSRESKADYSKLVAECLGYSENEIEDAAIEYLEDHALDSHMYPLEILTDVFGEDKIDLVKVAATLEDPSWVSLPGVPGLCLKRYVDSTIGEEEFINRAFAYYKQNKLLSTLAF